ncbi:MAG TPA: hypothetical protein VGG62_03665 [Terracidiphilus sp.]
MLEWLVRDGEEFHPGTRLAIAETEGRLFAVLANGNGFVRKRLSSVGSELEPGTPIATADADGENIPYDRPCSIAEWINPFDGTGI